ncbi:MAG: ribosome biogenesis GTPase Der [Magnetococcales bacterium]|nr:ribosome biogenesis GTPase Der [Magnetococcales bacterium]MBF0438712.1 ribosome biogenesis GTPase Der [Magnetococcales bacterium]
MSSHARRKAGADAARLAGLGPLLALVGRPNVGKSSLFNRLTRTRDALVDDTPGLTRDRKYGNGLWGNRPFRVVDTGGFEFDAREPLSVRMHEQAMFAVEEADVLLFIMDARTGPMPDDWELVRLLRRSGKMVVCVVNKAESNAGLNGIVEFHALGLQPVIAISATHGIGVDELLRVCLARFKEPVVEEDAPLLEENEVVRVAIVGCPNAGKSTLVNRLLGEERLVTSDEAGTTRDAVDAPLTDAEGHRFILVDTAGIRRKARISLRIEKYAAIAALQAMERAGTGVLVLDAVRGISEQDQRVAGHAMEAGCGLVLAVNKWDTMARGKAAEQAFMRELTLSFPRFAHAPVVFLSGKTGWHVDQLLPAARKVWEAGRQRISTGVLNRWLAEVVDANPHPRQSGRPVKIRFASQIRTNPPTLLFFANRPDAVEESYRRYLENRLRDHFGFQGVPIRIHFRSSGGENPYVDK